MNKKLLITLISIITIVTILASILIFSLNKKGFDNLILANQQKNKSNNEKTTIRKDEPENPDISLLRKTPNTLEKELGITTIDKNNNIIKKSLLDNTILSSYTLPNECANTDHNNISKISKFSPAQYIITCDSKTKYIFDSDGLILQINNLNLRSNSILLSQDYKYLAYTIDNEGAQLLTIHNLESNNKTYFKFVDPLNPSITEVSDTDPLSIFFDFSNIFNVYADCVYYGPYPIHFDKNNLYVNYSCVGGGATGIQKINLSNKVITQNINVPGSFHGSNKISENHILVSDTQYSDNNNITISNTDISSDKVITQYSLDTKINFGSAGDGMSPIISVSNDGRYALIDSFNPLFNCKTELSPDLPDCENELEKLVIFDNHLGKTLMQIPKEAPYQYLYDYLYNDQENLYYLETHILPDGNKTQIKRINLNSKTVEVVKNIIEDEMVVGIDSIISVIKSDNAYRSDASIPQISNIHLEGDCNKIEDQDNIQDCKLTYRLDTEDVSIIIGSKSCKDSNIEPNLASCFYSSAYLGKQEGNTLLLISQGGDEMSAWYIIYNVNLTTKEIKEVTSKEANFLPDINIEANKIDKSCGSEDNSSFITDIGCIPNLDNYSVEDQERFRAIIETNLEYYKLREEYPIISN